MSRSPLEPRLLKLPLVVAGREQAALRIEDLSGRARCGCKGPEAEGWLRAHGFSVPAAPNSAAVDPDGVLVARLASSEFLIEAVSGSGERLARVRGELGPASRPAGVYPVARQDLVVGLHGPGLQSLLRQICSVDFVPLFEAAGRDSGPVALTSMVGVGVVAWPRRSESGANLTVWSDPSFAHYLWTTLLEVGRSVGAMVIGSNS